MKTSVRESVPRQWFRRVWNELDAGAIDELFAADGVAHGLGGPPIVGPNGFREFHDAFTKSFSAIRIDVLHEVTEGDLVVLRCAANVTAAATNRPAQFEGFAIFRLRGGQIAEAWNTWDFLGLLESMGAAPADEAVKRGRVRNYRLGTNSTSRKSPSGRYPTFG